MEGHPKANGFIRADDRSKCPAIEWLEVAARPTCRENVLEIATYRETTVDHALTK